MLLFIHGEPFSIFMYPCNFCGAFVSTCYDLCQLVLHIYVVFACNFCMDSLGLR